MISGDEVPGEQVDGYQQWTCEAALLVGVGSESSVDVEETCTSFGGGEPLVVDYDPSFDLVRGSLTVEAWTYLDVPVALPAGEGVGFSVIHHQDSVVTDGDGTDYLLAFDGTEELVFVTGPLAVPQHRAQGVVVGDECEIADRRLDGRTAQHRCSSYKLDQR